MTLVIGLTGGIASGKSTVSHMLKEYGIPVIDADQIARDVVEPGEKAYGAIVETFGHNVLNDDQTIDRKKLGAIVFANDNKRKQLNAIVHPAVREKMIRKRDALKETDVPCVVLDIPLLYESDLTHFVDKTIVVAVHEDVQLDRLMKRDHYDKTEAKQRIAAQMPIKEKAALADAVLDNNGTRAATREQLKDVLKKWGVFP
ncbi:MAG TPA: dephospho-CoA kinase [Bacillota bacterium]|nr:dephospho-CoA kinase [Bacillota bacterium]